MKYVIRLLSLALCFYNTPDALAQFGVNSITWSPTDPTPCDSITFTVSGDHDQAGITNYWLTDTLINDTIYLTVQAIIPPISFGGLTPFTLYKTIAPLNADTFIVFGDYNAIISVPYPTPATKTDTLIIDSTYQAYAGKDTSYCDTNFIQLDAKPPSTGSSGSWTVLSGNATLTSSTVYDPIASNLSYGMNSFLWSVTGGNCGTSGSSDTVHIFMSRQGLARTMSDFFHCYDTVTIMADDPKGLGQWQVLTGGSMISNAFDSITLASNLSNGINKFEWTASDSNGICPSVSDILEIEYRESKGVNIIRIQDTLIAGTAPFYQWHKDGNAIPGATNQRLPINSNGTYKVKTDANGCDNGPFSNEIVVDDMVGIEQIPGQAISIYPIPTDDFLIISMDNSNGQTNRLRILDMRGRLLMNQDVVFESNKVKINTAALQPGVYVLILTEGEKSIRERLIIE